jgi:putative intracellular protease/amidase/DNA-directed RNA polymerase subunit RPC12/RpoP
MTIQLKRRSLMTLMGLAPAYLLLPLRRFATVWNIEGAASKIPQTQTASARTYRCPPCGLECDKLRFDKPGDCPKCGMKLVPADGGEGSPPTVAVLLFNGVQIIDFAGPWEVFGTAGFLVHTVAEKLDPVTTVFGQTVVPDFTFENSPRADILLIPGGGIDGPSNNPRVIQWIQEKAKNVSHVMSVCTGAFILGKTGLLEGLSATTTFGMIDDLTAFKANVVHDRRFVDNGKVITTAGLTAGIDGALHVVSKVLGQGDAQAVALEMEYDWKPDSTFARAALADQYLRDGFGVAKGRVKGVSGKLLSTKGDTSQWETKFLVAAPDSPAAILDAVRSTLSSDIQYLRGNAVKLLPANSKDTGVRWTFVDDTKHPWKGLARTEPAVDQNGKFILTLKIWRA